MNKHQSLEISTESKQGTKTLELALCSQSCWGNLLGRWAMPGAGAIDELDAFFGDTTPDRITLRGCPSACLLPMLWMRSIWFPVDAPELLIDWSQVDDPSPMLGRQPAGKLACIMADEINCADPDAAWLHWGIDPQSPIGLPEEGFDLLTNIVDLWDTDLHQNKLGVDWNDSIGHALSSCASRGYQRIGVYGAGTHTRAVGSALMEPSVEIVCLIDDDSRRHGQRMWGFEIVSREQAIGLGLDAVVISANSIEDLLWEQAELFRQQGIATIRLYGQSPEPKVLA